MIKVSIKYRNSRLIFLPDPVAKIPRAAFDFPDGVVTLLPLEVALKSLRSPRAVLEIPVRLAALPDHGPFLISLCENMCLVDIFVEKMENSLHLVVSCPSVPVPYDVVI